MHEVTHPNQLVIQRATITDKGLVVVCLLLARGSERVDLVPRVPRKGLSLLGQRLEAGSHRCQFTLQGRDVRAERDRRSAEQLCVA